MVGFRTKEYEMVPAGTHPFRCYGVIDFGTQKREYQGEKYTQAEVNLLLEFPTELMKDGRPFTMKAGSFNFSLTLTPKSKLAKFLKSWLPSENIGKQFDFATLLGKEGMANVVHTSSSDGSKTYANIMSVMPLPKGMAVPPPVNKTIYISLDDKWDGAAFEGLPEYFKDQIKDSPEYNAIMDNLVGAMKTMAKDMEKAQAPKGTGDDEIPF